MTTASYLVTGQVPDGSAGGEAVTLPADESNLAERVAEMRAAGMAPVIVRPSRVAVLVARSSVAASALLALAVFIGGFTGRLGIESPWLLAAITTLAALCGTALAARRRADWLDADYSITHDLDQEA